MEVHCHTRGFFLEAFFVLENFLKAMKYLSSPPRFLAFICIIPPDIILHGWVSTLGVNYLPTSPRAGINLFGETLFFFLVYRKKLRCGPLNISLLTPIWIG